MQAQRLRQAAANLSVEWALERWARQRGDAVRGLAGVLGRSSVAMDPDLYQEARSGREQQPAESEEARRFRRLEGFCARALLEARGAAHDDEALGAELAARITLEGEVRPYRDVLGQIASEGRRERRAVMAREVVATSLRFESSLCRGAEARSEMAVSLGFGDEPRFIAASEGFDLEALAAEARSVLDGTLDAYRDLTMFLRRREVGLPAGKAKPEWHDLVRALASGSLAAQMGSSRVSTLAGHVAGELGLREAFARIQWDSEVRPQRALGHVVHAEAPPFDVSIGLRLQGLPTDYLNAVIATGEGMAFALVDPDRDADERRLLDPAWIAGLGQLFGRVLVDPLWHRRTFQVASTAAIENARVFAVNMLHHLRLASAGTLLGIALGKDGPTSHLREFHADLMEKTACSRWPSAWWIQEARRFADAATDARGSQLVGSLAFALRDRFNEDWWRNPAAGRFLAGQASKGGSLDAGMLAKELRPEPATLLDAANQLVSAAAV